MSSSRPKKRPRPKSSSGRANSGRSPSAKGMGGTPIADPARSPDALAPAARAAPSVVMAAADERRASARTGIRVAIRASPRLRAENRAAMSSPAVSRPTALTPVEAQDADQEASRVELETEIGELRAQVVERGRAEDTLRRLLAASDALSGALAPSEVVDIVTRAVIDALEARAAEISRLEDTDLVLIGARGYEPEVAAMLARMPVSAAWPLAEAVRTGEPVFVATTQELRARYPRADRRLLRMTTGALACVPLALEGQTVGAL